MCVCSHFLCSVMCAEVVWAQQLPRVCDIIQALTERSRSFLEETLETPSAGWSSAHQKHDRETLGDRLQYQKVYKHLYKVSYFQNPVWLLLTSLNLYLCLIFVVVQFYCLRFYKLWSLFLLFNSHQRILLINTPLQNTLKELWTMIHFLLPGITHPYLNFPVKPGTDQNQDYCHKLVIRLHRVKPDNSHTLGLYAEKILH